MRVLRDHVLTTSKGTRDRLSHTFLMSGADRARAVCQTSYMTLGSTALKENDGNSQPCNACRSVDQPRTLENVRRATQDRLRIHAAHRDTLLERILRELAHNDERLAADLETLTELYDTRNG